MCEIEVEREYVSFKWIVDKVKGSFEEENDEHLTKLLRVSLTYVIIIINLNEIFSCKKMFHPMISTLTFICTINKQNQNEIKISQSVIALLMTFCFTFTFFIYICLTHKPIFFLSMFCAHTISNKQKEITSH